MFELNKISYPTIGLSTVTTSAGGDRSVWVRCATSVLNLKVIVPKLKF